MTPSVRLKYLLRETDARAGSLAGELPLLSVSITWGVRRRQEKLETESRADDLSNYKVCQKGDLVVNRMRAFQGALGIAWEDGLVSPDYAVLRINESITAGWLQYVMTSQPFVAAMARSVRGIGGTEDGSVRTPRLSVRDLGQLRVRVPGPTEQSQTAARLDRETAQIDALIAKQEQLITTLRERRSAIPEFALHNLRLDGAPRLKHYVVGVTQGWSPQCYGWPSPDEHHWAVLKAGAANGGTFRPGENKELPSEIEARPELVVRRGRLLVSRANTRDLVGSAAVVPRDYPRLMLSDKLYAIELDETKASPDYVATILGTARWRDLIQLQATGASPSMQNVSQADILSLPLPLPSLESQRETVIRVQKEISQVDALINKAREFVERSRERRSALITAAVTGQLDVRERVS